MKANELFDIVIKKAKEFGFVPKNDGRTIIEPKGNGIIRNNLLDASFADGSAYFGIINEDEETAGPYSDFSFVVFPEEVLGACVVSLTVGSSGFKNDYQLASLPGLRRSFLKLRTNNCEDKDSLQNNTFFKTSFDDIESTCSDLIKEIRASYPGLKNVIETYKTVHPAARIVDFNDSEEEALNVIYTWLATYARMRGWGTAAQKKQIEATISQIPSAKAPDERKEIIELLEQRKYVVLQGAPGTGKTWNALEIAKKYDKTLFVQFHAETTYSDFVYGIEPNLSAEKGQSQFKPKDGILLKAINYAKEHSGESVLLIIDEINRANLSNVLGPVFYLFEYSAGHRDAEIRIGEQSYAQLPNNLHVIATMNTSDRSLAVVDFALRRRFAWYTLRPHALPGKNFDQKMFQKFADIFFEYATDDELNLQPGQSYFTDKLNMKNRMIYELMPLIKEYLAEGYLQKAKDSFCDLFLKETGKLMYE